MPPLILIPFFVFFACCAAQFWFMKQVRDRLIDQHPDTFLEVERASFFPGTGLWEFTRGSNYKDLCDEELNRRVRNFKRLFVVAIVSWAAFALGIALTPVG